MGGSFDIKTKLITCGGEQVTAKLNQVFLNPGTQPYQQPPYQDNWKDLLIAYLIAGVNAGNEFPAWCFYLEAVGAQNIKAIAEARYDALNSNQGMLTHTHGGGGGVHTTPGNGSGPGSQPADIDSPCPP
jgi:hypothetical protein